MKQALLFAALFFLPACDFAQVEHPDSSVRVDTAAVIRQVDSLIQVSRTLTGQRDFDKALEVNGAAERLALEKLGRESAGYGSVCFNHGRVLYYKGDYLDAEKWYLEAKTIREKVLGKEHPDYAWSLNNLGILHDKIGDYGKAEPFYLEAKAIREKVLGKEHPDYAGSLNNLALLFYNLRDYEKAELLYLEAKAIREKVLGKENYDYAANLNNLANLYLVIGNFKKAEPLLLEAKAIREKILGKEHPDYAWSLHNLGVLYFKLGDYRKVEPLLFEAKAIWEKVFGKEHADYARALNGLGVLYENIGNYGKAESFYLETKAILEKILGEKHPDYAGCIHNLGILYYKLGDYRKAEPFLLEAKAIREKILGKDHPKYVQSLVNLSALYGSKGDYGKTEQLLIEAIAIQEKVSGKEHPDNANNLNNLGFLYWSIGDYGKAEPFLLETKAIREKILGKEHPDYALGLSNLGRLYWKKGDFGKAELLFDELADLNKTLATGAVYYMSERELNNYLNQFLEWYAEILSFLQIPGNTLPRISQVCYDNSLFYKGFLLNAANRLKRLALSDSLATEQFNRLKSYRFLLAKEYAKPLAERDSAHVVEWEEKANTIEKELARTVAGFGEALRQVTWQEVQENLHPGEAAIEFIHYRYYTPKPTDSTMYAALVLRPGDAAPHFVPLFEERQLADLMQFATGSNDLAINLLYKGKALHDLIWQPLEALLKDVKTVHCSPSGLLHRLNLGAIPGGEGQIFSGQRRLVLLGSTRQLVVPDQQATPSGNDAYLVGGVRYDLDDTPVPACKADLDARLKDPAFSAPTLPSDSSRTRGGFDYLPGTLEEALKIDSILQAARLSVQLATGYLATEECVKFRCLESPSPWILHFATHGFFFPDLKERRTDPMLGMENEPAIPMSEHPMMRSVLLFAGGENALLPGKQLPQGREDGVLTAYEISQMNLAATELVVLSACATGLGDLSGNEGVYGLQRAFRIAGAKYLIMSLWDVNDVATQELMSEFYSQWLEEGLTIPEAFRAAQGKMKEKHPDSPYLWAGFVLVE